MFYLKSLVYCREAVPRAERWWQVNIESFMFVIFTIRNILFAPHNSDGWHSVLLTTRYFFNHAPSLQSPGLEASTLEQVTTCSNLSDANPNNMQCALWIIWYLVKLWSSLFTFSRSPFFVIWRLTNVPFITFAGRTQVKSRKLRDILCENTEIRRLQPSVMKKV